jgi:hypothetical protein
MSGDAISSKGIQMFLSKGTPDKATVVPTAITKAKPAHVTAPDPGAPVSAYAVGQLVEFHGTGFPELDELLFTVAAPIAGGFSAFGSDTTASTGSLAATGATIDVYSASSMLPMCLNNIAFNLTAAGTINVGTYCNPTATMPSTPTGIGTMTLGGWINVADPAYAELLHAVDDGLARIFTITLPQGQGQIISTLILTEVTWALPLDGGMAYTATGTLTTKPRHLF